MTLEDLWQWAWTEGLWWLATFWLGVAAGFLMGQDWAERKRD